MSADSSSVLSEKGNLQRRRETRLMIVQALYEISQTQVSPQLVEKHFFEQPLKNYFEEKGILGNRLYFREVVQGVVNQQEKIDGHIKAFLSDRWRLERLEATVCAILRAAVYELLFMWDVPPPLLINEYVTLAHGFFSEREPQFVNAVLDKIAAKVRMDVST